jgi:hypothetical protein
MPKEMEIHHAVCYDNLPQPAVPLEEVDAWFGKILRANRESEDLDPIALRHRLHLQRYYHLAKNRPAAKWMDLLRSQGELGRVPLGLAIKSLVKRFAGRSIGGHADES